MGITRILGLAVDVDMDLSQHPKQGMDCHQGPALVRCHYWRIDDVAGPQNHVE